MYIHAHSYTQYKNTSIYTYVCESYSHIYTYVRTNLLLILAGGVAVYLPIQPVVRVELAFLGLLQRRLWEMGEGKGSEL